MLKILTLVCAFMAGALPAVAQEHPKKQSVKIAAIALAARLLALRQWAL